MCKKQASVSHRSSESKVVSLDANDGLFALEIFDVLKDVLRSSNGTKS